MELSTDRGRKPTDPRGNKDNPGNRKELFKLESSESKDFALIKQGQGTTEKQG